MYMSSATRPYHDSYRIGYDELPFSSNKNGYPLGRHKRIRTQNTDRQSMLQKQLWDLERKDLKQQLQSERNSHRKSIRMIKELIEDNSKYYQKNKQSKSYYPDHRFRSIYTSGSFTNYKKSQKQFEKPTNLSHTQNNITKYMTTSNVTQTNKPKYMSNSSLLQTNKVEKTIKADLQDNKKTKQVILKKLYEQNSNKKELKIKKSPKTPSPLKLDKHSYLQDEITFLKNQLQEKNRQIVDLQCDIIKLNRKNSSVNIDFDDDSQSGNPQKEIKETRIRQLNLQKQNCISLQIKPQLVKPKMALMKQIDITIKQKEKAEKQMQTWLKNPLQLCSMWNISIQDSGQVHKLQQKLIIAQKLIDQQIQKRKKLQQHILNEQNSKKQELKRYQEIIKQKQVQKERERQHQLLNLLQINEQLHRQIEIRRETEKEWKIEKDTYENNKKQMEAKLNQAMSQLNKISKQLKEQKQQHQKTFNQLQGRISVEKQQIGVQTKQKKMKDRYTSPQCNDMEQKQKELAMMESPMMQSGMMIEEECQTILSLMNLRQESSQTSENIYDYIEESYLQWMFEKEYKDLQKSKE